VERLVDDKAFLFIALWKGFAFRTFCTENRKNEMIGHLGDTIAAIATPMGEGAISVIRVSGESALKNVANRFKGKQNLANAKSHTAHFGRIVDTKGNIIDDVVCTVFLAPTSFTGEETVEVSCHGGIHVTRQVLECLLETGTRPAQPGEFTQRAFLNGKLDLSQAEAVADLIQAQTDKAYKTSLNQLEGTLSKEIRLIRDQLVKSVGLLELELDFVEEDLELINRNEFEISLESGILAIEKLLNTYKYGKVWREGVRVALVGVPNAGKSSLLNALLHEERAIVTDVPGTTRDFIEEKITISGVLFRIIDTAGLRQTEDSIEQEGVKRTWKIAQTSDIIVLVHDSSKLITNDELEFLYYIRKNHPQSSLIIANNKIDLQSKKVKINIEIDECIIVETSAILHEGINMFISVLEKQILDKSQAENRESITITNERHYSALSRAKEGLTSSLKSSRLRESGEFIALDLRRAINAIGEILGLVTTEDILDSIFSKFCIGK
jgi:tRNA modification GTPase